MLGSVGTDEWELKRLQEEGEVPLTTCYVGGLETADSQFLVREPHGLVCELILVVELHHELGKLIDLPSLKGHVVDVKIYFHIDASGDELTVG